MTEPDLKNKKMTLISSKGTLDWAYPPFILASTAASMEIETTIFFTFYGLLLLKKDLDLKVSPHSNPAMPMKMPFGSEKFRNLEWPLPNLLTGNMPFFNDIATSFMKKTFSGKKVPTIEQFRDLCLKMGVKLIACQMTMEVFGFSKEDFIDEAEVAGAAAYLGKACEADINLFI